MKTEYSESCFLTLSDRNCNLSKAGAGLFQRLLRGGMKTWLPLSLLPGKQPVQRKAE